MPACLTRERSIPTPVQKPVARSVELVLDRVRAPIRRSVTHEVPPLAEVPLHTLQFAEGKCQFRATSAGLTRLTVK